MLLMKDMSFLYELRAYLIYVKVGETFLSSIISLSQVLPQSGTQLDTD